VPEICPSVDAVQRLVESEEWRRIGIDGTAGAGKTELAEALSQGLGLPVLDVTDYLHQNQGGYVDFIDYPALAAAMAAIPAFILCGACLQQVLVNLGTALDGQVYVMRMRDGVWLDEEECVFPEGVEAAIESLVSNNAMITQHFDEPTEYVGFERDDESLSLAMEVMRYHAEFSPHETADAIYERGV
jgi:hypothetical protein